MQKGAGEHEEERGRGIAGLYLWLQAYTTSSMLPWSEMFSSQMQPALSSSSLPIQKQFNTVFSKYTPFLRVWTNLRSDVHTYSAQAEKSEFLIQ